MSARVTARCGVHGFGRELPADVLDDLPIEAPAFPGNLLREAQVVVDVGRLLLRTPDLLAQPRGDSDPVLVLPGYGAGDGSTWLLRGYLRCSATTCAAGASGPIEVTCRPSCRWCSRA